MRRLILKYLFGELLERIILLIEMLDSHTINNDIWLAKNSLEGELNRLQGKDDDKINNKLF